MNIRKKLLGTLLSFLLLTHFSAGYFLPASGAVISTVTPTVAIGQNFMVALNALGEAYAWGSNASGNLGNGTTERSAHAVKVTMPSGVTFTDIDAGANHVIALTTDGTVYTWGSNATGQLGYEDPKDKQTTPKEVELLKNLSVTAVAAGNGFSLALLEDGAVYAWGDNTFLALGTQTLPEGASFTFHPTKIEALTGNYITQIVADDSCAAAITGAGTVYFWGKNESYRFGMNGTGNLLPTVHASLSSCSELAFGGSHTVALLSNKTLKAAGLNDKGEFGIGQESEPDAPYPFFKETRFTTPAMVSKVAAGTNHTVILGTDGVLYTYGDNSQGQLGYSGMNVQYKPKAVDLGENRIAGIDAAYNNTAIVTTDGKVYTWGESNADQLGHGIVNDTGATPLAVLGPNGQTDLVLGIGSDEIKQDVAISVQLNVPAPTYTVIIPESVPLGILNQKREESEDRYNATEFSVQISNVDNLFGESKIVIAVQSEDTEQSFLLRDLQDPSFTLPFEILAGTGESAHAVTPGGVFAQFVENGSATGSVRVDQSLITRDGAYSGRIQFVVRIEPLQAED
ncbi:MAG: hypothetical protein II369_02800 [Clostridia bacterium]|nr:hypothetical protein [Clostridia bacterium]